MGLFRQGDIVEVSFDPSKGHEPAKSRPALVLGSDFFNRMSSLTVVAPIPSTDNRYPLHIELAPENVVRGFVCVEQMAALDLMARRTSVLGQADAATMRSVLEAIGAVFGI